MAMVTSSRLSQSERIYLTKIIYMVRDNALTMKTACIAHEFFYNTQEVSFLCYIHLWLLVPIPGRASERLKFAERGYVGKDTIESRLRRDGGKPAVSDSCQERLYKKSVSGRGAGRTRYAGTGWKKTTGDKTYGLSARLCRGDDGHQIYMGWKLDRVRFGYNA
jgi:hypothetical protein